ncbi:AraC family transcriptional regulator [Dietzia maris]|uniref:AraC family transcriptional regulator n=1 Tax=Dietzia maris TaxID=37915 RepID=UPI00232FAFB5|nr:helix-turn-helix transcriptional regulator [Dietzia maris]
MGDLDDARGLLFPDALPRFHRREVQAGSAHLARWYWIAQWDLPDGLVSTQSLLPFPASNLVVGPDGITLSGPTTAASGRDLTGRGWAFGVLLRAAGSAARVMSERLAGIDARRKEPIPEGAVLADRMIGIVESDPAIVGVGQLAREMGMSTRALQRLAKQYIGLSPLRIIRRYRLQEAALRLREDPGLTVARVAAELGYADQSHLAADFRSTLGLSARDYRRQRQP